MKKIFLVLMVLLCMGLVSAKPVSSGENPAFSNYMQFGELDVYCHTPKNPNVTLCKVYQEIEVGEAEFETVFVSNAHIWINTERSPPGNLNWTPLFGMWVRFTPEADVL